MEKLQVKRTELFISCSRTTHIRAGLSMGRVSEAVCDSLLGNVAVSSLARRAEKRNERASSHASFASGKFHVSKRY